MNEHLAPVFKIILPELEKNNIDYWVYGGVSIAGYAQKFIRENSDIDIFIKECDFEKTHEYLKQLCKKNDFELCIDWKKGRPRINVKIEKKNRFSMIPVFLKSDTALFKYKDGDQKFPLEILNKIRRSISNYKFFTTEDRFIKEMFIKHIEVRRDKIKKLKIIKDANTILNSKEIERFGFTKQ